MFHCELLKECTRNSFSSSFRNSTENSGNSSNGKYPRSSTGSISRKSRINFTKKFSRKSKEELSRDFTGISQSTDRNSSRCCNRHSYMWGFDLEIQHERHHAAASTRNSLKIPLKFTLGVPSEILLVTPPEILSPAFFFLSSTKIFSQSMI